MFIFYISDVTFVSHIDEAGASLGSTSDIIPDAELTYLIYKLQNQSNVQILNKFHVRNESSLANTFKSNKILDRKYPEEQRRRVSRIRQVCRDTDSLRDLIYKDKNSTRYYYSRTYGFSYCKVPKSGSTFWTQAFFILEKGVQYRENVFSKSRSGVHSLMAKFLVNFNSPQRKHSLTILVSRDPFSRLYSAFIDKSFLNLDKGLNEAIIRQRTGRNNNLCPDDVTFQEFLDFTIHRTTRGFKLNRHWAPIYSLCRPCDVNAYFLVKQESFSDDVEQALKAFNVPDEKLDAIISALHEHRVETSVPGIIRTVIARNNKKNRTICDLGQRLIEKMWTSFKIQGYLKRTVEFPSTLFTNKNHFYNASYVTDVFLNAINRNKMTSLEMKTQRHKALVNAYGKIRSETLQQIKDIYKLDFKLFNYPTIVPH